MSMRAVGGQVRLKWIELRHPLLHELMQNLSTKRFPGVWGVFSSVVLPQEIHDPFGHRAAGSGCLRPRRTGLELA